MDTHLTETLQFEYPPPDSVDSKQTLDGSSHNSPPPQTLDCLLNSSAAPPDSNPDNHSDSALFGGVDSQKNEENDAFNSSHWSSMGWDSRGGTKTSASASASGWSDWPSVEDTKPSSLDWSDSMPLQEETVAKVSDSVSPDWSSEAKPAMVGAGLANLGNTCFLNAILQCFTHIVPLVQGLRSYNHPRPCDRDNEGFCVICTLRDHIEYSIASMDRVVSPWKLVDNLNYISSNFRRFQQEDAHEFLQCLLDRLDSCCIYSQTKDTSLPSADESLVKQVFGGRLISKLQCYNCGHSSDTYEPLIDLSLEIENVGALPSALESFTKVEKIEDPETKFTCEQCKEKVSVEKQLILNQAPSVAAFHLKRFKNDGSYVEKIDKHVEFPLELDLLPYTGGDQNNDVELKYNLYAVVVHIGFSSTSGHYYCFIRSAPDAWYRLDDSKVTRVREDFVLSQEAYILFYAKEGTPWFSSFMETEKSSIDPNLFSNSPQSVLDNVDRIGTSSPNVADNCSGEVNEAGEVAVGISVDSFNKRTHNSVEVDEAKDDSHRLFTPVPLVMSNSSSETAYKVERKFSPSALRDNNSNREFNKVAKNVNIIPSTPLSSPSPDIYAEEPPTVTYSIPRNHLISEKQVPCKRQLDKDLEDSERNQAHKLLKIMPNDRSAKLLDNGLEDSERKQARKLLKGMPNDRSAKLLAAMNGSHNEGRRSRRIESSSNRNERPSSARHNPNLSSFTRPVSAGSLR
ncbi:ubiquitin carboxyl-terminal hydrolase 21-like isoform X1 [Camellia sinensis]|uniref:ubiquitin carboxyl-terminal hydrolase 21-like isoform X1 n=1 Tax=Camellia sinensis TaxID=4442 RepID=UPI0010356135|nr:ubiquitin carboxyl-terminal hydrolase 21-like isoform X1 [Camellia sinensis]